MRFLAVKPQSNNATQVRVNTYVNPDKDEHGDFGPKTYIKREKRVASSVTIVYRSDSCFS